MPFDANDEETKTAIKEAVEAAVDAAKEGLESKNRDLLAKLKKAKEGASIDPSDYQQLEVERDALATKLAAAEKATKDATKLAEKAAKDLEAEQSVTHKLVAENGVIAALTAANVTDAAYLDGAKAIHLGKVKIVVDGGDRKAMYGDKPLDEAIKEWAGTDAGKKYVTAPNNSGGGAQGGKGSGEGGKVITQEQSNAMRPKERAAHFAAGGTIAETA